MRDQERFGSDQECACFVGHGVVAETVVALSSLLSQVDDGGRL
jgi:hypothetical protein